MKNIFLILYFKNRIRTRNTLFIYKTVYINDKESNIPIPTHQEDLLLNTLTDHIIFLRYCVEGGRKTRGDYENAGYLVLCNSMRICCGVFMYAAVMLSLTGRKKV